MRDGLPDPAPAGPAGERPRPGNTGAQTTGNVTRSIGIPWILASH